MIEAIHFELECALDDPAAEVSRLLDMQKLTYSPLSSICAQCLEEGGACLCELCSTGTTTHLVPMLFPATFLLLPPTCMNDPEGVGLINHVSAILFAAP